MGGSHCCPPLGGHFQDFIGCLHRLEALGGFGVVGIEIWVIFLGHPPVCGLDGCFIRVWWQIEQAQCIEFGAAAGAIAFVPLPMARALPSSGLSGLLLLVGGGFFVCQLFEIIPAPIIFGGMFFTEIPAIRTVGGFGRRAKAGLGATMAVA